MLRRWLLGTGLLLMVLAAVALVVVPGAIGAAIWLLVAGVVLSAGVALERWRYRPRIDRAHGSWQSTAERFVDPATGRLTEVRFNPETGQRDYVDVGKPS